MATRIRSYSMEGITIDLFVTDCVTCGVVFALSEQLERRRREDGGTWYCPNGHQMVFRETKAERERKARERAEREAARLQQALDEEQREHRETERDRRRMAKRIANGVCPHCNRYFANVHRHMETRHGDEASKPEPAALAVHKQSYRQCGSTRWAKCWRAVPAVRASLHWNGVTCKDCLRHKPGA